MRRKILTALLALFFGHIYAQKDVTTFLGIPVDGTKAEMISKLKAKGFSYDTDLDVLKGKFNECDSYINIQTNNNNKVWRIIVVDATPLSETGIRNRFNALIDMFCEKEDKYMMGGETKHIPEDEDISYEMTIHNKRYQAMFFQRLKKELLDFEEGGKQINKVLKQKYSEEQLRNPTVEEKADIIKITEEESNRIYDEMLLAKKVWFMIAEQYGEYSIYMYYENQYNSTLGDDL